MQTYNNVLVNTIPLNYHPTRLQELVYSQLINLNTREIMLIYEMIQLFRKPKEIKIETERGFPFLKVQQALKNVQGNLSNDIISERDERL